MTKMEQIINELYSTRYDYLLECAENILKKSRKTNLKYDLVSETYMHMMNKQVELEEALLNGKAEAIAVNVMNMQIKWGVTAFKKKWMSNSGREYMDKLLTENQFMTDFSDETIPEEELLQYEKEIQDKLNHINCVIGNSDMDTKRLYDLVYVQGYNTSGKLSKHTGISRTTCYRMMLKLKKDLKDGYNFNK